VIVPGSNGVIFDATQLKQTFDVKNPDMIFGNTEQERDFVPERIYVFSDPNADGASNTTVFSCFMAPPRDKGGFERMVMLGLDVENTYGGHSKDALLLTHIKTIRQMAQYSKVPILCMFENNTGDYATHGEELVLENLESVVALHEGGPDKPAGYCMKKDLKVAFVYETERKMDNAQIAWSSKLFTRSKNYATRLRESNFSKETDVELIMKELMLEMCRMRYEKGKITGKVGPYQDDMAITLMMASYWTKVVENKYSPVYRYYRDLRWVEHAQGTIQSHSLSILY
jgi:hypothetical protein